MSINGTGYLVVGVMEEKYFSFDHKRNVMRWMNRQIYIPHHDVRDAQGRAAGARQGRASCTCA